MINGEGKEEGRAFISYRYAFRRYKIAIFSF